MVSTILLVCAFACGLFIHAFDNERAVKIIASLAGLLFIGYVVARCLEVGVR